ncbi:uncharacterized protein LOC143538913 isoform X2 [Bidens hawaiensis]|uniref:uncharacterized protein LOC143538913 isoform X2 n=1 Tax=Bidens hawaiensis TaxID=980011 RepID=UPI004048EB19
MGHTVDKCFELIGYPSWMKPRNGQGKKTNGNNNNNNSVVDNVASINNSTSTPSVSGLSSEQIVRLLSLLDEKTGDSHQSCNVSDNMSPWFCSMSITKPQFCFASSSNVNNVTGWVVDSGANQHMVMTDKDLINPIYVIDLNIKVKRPNGTSVVVTKIGNIKLSNRVTLCDVFVVPDYNVNLMSVHKLAKDSKLTVSFDEFKCSIQDSLTKSVLVTGNQIDGLYICGGSTVTDKDSILCAKW